VCVLSELRYDTPMKTPPDNPEFARFTEAMKTIVKVSKVELQRRMEAENRDYGAGDGVMVVLHQRQPSPLLVRWTSLSTSEFNGWEGDP
jgi:hypothetical protein